MSTIGYCPAIGQKACVVVLPEDNVWGGAEYFTIIFNFNANRSKIDNTMIGNQR
jgi:hypothetical protein